VFLIVFYIQNLFSNPVMCLKQCLKNRTRHRIGDTSRSWFKLQWL